MNRIVGTFQQIPFWKLRARFRACGFRDGEVAASIGVSTSTMSLRLCGKKPWATKEINDICELLNIPQERVGEYFFPHIAKENKEDEKS